MIMNEYNVKKTYFEGSEITCSNDVPFLKILLPTDILSVMEGISFKIPDI